MGKCIARLTRSALGATVIGQAFGVSIGSTGNAIVTFPANDVTKWRVTKITAWGPSGSCTSAVISVGTAAAGGSLLTDGSTALSSLSGSTKCQDLVLASGVSTSIQTANKLYFNVGTAATGVTLNITVYGDVLTN
jgi:hypothetical protein